MLAVAMVPSEPSDSNAGFAGEGPEPPPPGELRPDPALQVRDLLQPVGRRLEVPSGWQSLFDASDTRELLARLADGDPLDMRRRGIRFARQRSIAIHADRLWMRALAIAAYKGMLYTGIPTLEDWCDGIVRRGARDLLQDDLLLEFEREPLDAESEVGFRFAVELFGVEPPLSRLCALRFNLLEPKTRSVLWAIVLEGRSLGDLDPLEFGSAQEVRTRYRAGLEAIKTLKPPTLGELAVQENQLW